jgi:hypothetical protein
MKTGIWTGTKRTLPPGASYIRWHECDTECVSEIDGYVDGDKEKIARCRNCHNVFVGLTDGTWQMLRKREKRLASELIVARNVIAELKRER